LDSLWYQGESNVETARLYRTRFPAMIRSWRRAWGRDFPFLFVQLANHLERRAEPGPSAWAALREAQLMALGEPHTAMAVAIDVGEAEDIHPRNKQDVGRRLALAALAAVYGREVVGSGPLFRSHAVEAGAVRLRFESVGGALAASGGGPLRGFAVAGRDRKFRWAEARIEGETVVVRSPAVPEPVAARYAWADNPDCNLCNREGLPASPFRTDDWPE